MSIALDRRLGRIMIEGQARGFSLLVISGFIENDAHGSLRIILGYLYGNLIARLQQRIADLLALLVAELRVGEHPETKNLVAGGLQVKVLLAKLAEGSVGGAHGHFGRVVVG